MSSRLNQLLLVKILKLYGPTNEALLMCSCSTQVAVGIPKNKLNTYMIRGVHRVFPKVLPTVHLQERVYTEKVKFDPVGDPRCRCLQAVTIVQYFITHN